MTSLTIVRRIAARPQTVFEALTTPEGIVHWWGPDAGPVLVAEIDLRRGGRFRVRFRMLDGSEHESHGEVLDVDPPKRLLMSWNWLGREEDPPSRIEFVLHPIGEKTELVFTHSLLVGEASRDDHEQGWNGAFDKLEACLARRRPPDEPGAR